MCINIHQTGTCIQERVDDAEQRGRLSKDASDNHYQLEKDHAQLCESRACPKILCHTRAYHAQAYIRLRSVHVRITISRNIWQCGKKSKSECPNS
jgi:hypothetical protein